MVVYVYGDIDTIDLDGLCQYVSLNGCLFVCLPCDRLAICPGLFETYLLIQFKTLNWISRWKWMDGLYVFNLNIM